MYIVGAALALAVVPAVSARLGAENEGWVRWALWTLTVGDLAILPYWVLIFQPYLRAGTPLGLQDVPPLFLYLAVIVVAAILGWFGLR